MTKIGWYNRNKLGHSVKHESHRHSLAAKGIKTALPKGVKNVSFSGSPTPNFDMVAKGKPIFHVTTADVLVQRMKAKLKAPYISSYKSTLGGDETVSVMLTISLDKKSDWANDILENSNYGRFHIRRDGTIEHFSGNMRPYMRKSKAKDLDDAVDRINNYLEKLKNKKTDMTVAESKQIAATVPLKRRVFRAFDRPFFS